MPATTTTTEKLSTTEANEEQIKELVKLRMQAGAVRSTYKQVDGTWVLTTEWNLFGQQ